LIKNTCSEKIIVDTVTEENQNRDPLSDFKGICELKNKKDLLDKNKNKWCWCTFEIYALFFFFYVNGILLIVFLKAGYY